MTRDLSDVIELEKNIIKQLAEIGHNLTIADMPSEDNGLVGYSEARKETMDMAEMKMTEKDKEAFIMGHAAGVSDAFMTLITATIEKRKT